MNNFKKIPASKKSLAFRRLAYGVGINDADYITQPIINGKKLVCPIYRKWHSMLARCYSNSVLSIRPTYEGCTVCSEWFVFSRFSKWYEENYIEGFDLDKDIKIKGNKIYSPDACLFVPVAINALFTGIAMGKDRKKVGAKKNSKNDGYQANISIDGKNNHLGYFNTPEQASVAYVIGKNKEIMRKCDQYPTLAKYLVNHLMEVKS